MQVKLLTAACRAMKPGGQTVYSTCSIWPQQNDDVVLQVLAQLPEDCGKVNVLQLSATMLADAQQTPCGALWLPDNTGSGPIFCSVLQKAGTGT